MPEVLGFLREFRSPLIGSLWLSLVSLYCNMRPEIFSFFFFHLKPVNNQANAQIMHKQAIYPHYPHHAPCL